MRRTMNRPSIPLLGLVVAALAPSAQAKDSASKFSDALDKGQWYSALGIHIGSSLAFGGDQLVELTYEDGKKSGVNAGDGISLTGGLTLTPLWFADRVGLGLGLDAGYKFTSTLQAADGSVKLTRIPASAMIRGLVGLGRSWYVLGAGGIALEFSPQLSGEGVLSSVSANFKNAVGGRAELGFLRGDPHSFGAEITGSFTYMRFAIGSDSLNAMHGGVNFVLHYFL
jgi:hypothetical protein